MRCSQCGMELPEGAKFCRYCGNRITDPYPDISESSIRNTDQQETRYESPKETRDPWQGFAVDDFDKQVSSDNWRDADTSASDPFENKDQILHLIRQIFTFKH